MLRACGARASCGVIRLVSCVPKCPRVCMQGGSCGFGMRGQKSRSGTGAGSRPGFEGGQTPMYRQMPKLRGIAGGARATPPTLSRHVVRDSGSAVGALHAGCGCGSVAH